jgi:hypothetical protein
MNPRIKELAVECYNPYTEFDHAKFAELIIEECCKEIMYSSVGQEDPVFAYEYINHLRAKFGVKR